MWQHLLSLEIISVTHAETLDALQGASATEDLLS